MGGVSSLISKELDAGKPIKLIAQELVEGHGVSPDKILDAQRRTLKRWGYEVYETVEERNQRLDDIFSNPASRDEMVERAMQDVTITYYKARKGADGFFTALRIFLADYGFKREKRFLVIPEILQEANIPVGKVMNTRHQKKERGSENYPTFYLWNPHLDLAVQALDKNKWPAAGSRLLDEV